MRSLTGLYPEYADGVDFYAVNVDLSAELDELEAFGQKQGYPWRIAHSDREMLVNLHVTQQSTKIAFGGDGVIIYREGMGRGGLDKWREVFESLSG